MHINIDIECTRCCSRLAIDLLGPASFPLPVTAYLSSHGWKVFDTDLGRKHFFCKDCVGHFRRHPEKDMESEAIVSGIRFNVFCFKCASPIGQWAQHTSLHAADFASVVPEERYQRCERYDGIAVVLCNECDWTEEDAQSRKRLPKPEVYEWDDDDDPNFSDYYDEDGNWLGSEDDDDDMDTVSTPLHEPMEDNATESPSKPEE